MRKTRNDTKMVNKIHVTQSERVNHTLAIFDLTSKWFELFIWYFYIRVNILAPPRQKCQALIDLLLLCGGLLNAPIDL